MTSTTTTEAGTETRWISRVALAFLLASLFAVSSLGGASATDNDDLSNEDMCLLTGGQWIEVFYPSGALKSQGCYFPDGHGYECGTINSPATCKIFFVGPETPPKTVPGSGEHVGEDKGLSGEAAAEPTAADDEDAPKQPKKHKKGQGRGRHHR
jgi:hypothetical protein